MDFVVKLNVQWSVIFVHALLDHWPIRINIQFTTLVPTDYSTETTVAFNGTDFYSKKNNMRFKLSSVLEKQVLG